MCNPSWRKLSIRENWDQIEESRFFQWTNFISSQSLIHEASFRQVPLPTVFVPMLRITNDNRGLHAWLTFFHCCNKVLCLSLKPQHQHTNSWDVSPYGRCELMKTHFLKVQIRTQRIAGGTFRIFFHADWQIDNGFHGNILKSCYTGGCPEQGCRRCFAGGINLNLGSPVAQATTRRELTKRLRDRLWTFIELKRRAEDVCIFCTRQNWNYTSQ